MTGNLSVAVTTESVDDVTRAATTSPSSSRGIEFYFQWAVVVVGVAGVAANALILYAMVASKQHRKHVLIFNQNVCDFFGSLSLVITYAVKLCNIYLVGSAGYWFCMLIVGEYLVWLPVLASKTNIFFITIERYLKVVSPVWSKKNLRKWMIYVALALAWISSFVHITSLTFPTSEVIDGVCHAYVVFKSRTAQMAYGIFSFSAYYVIQLSTFIFCYGRILIAILVLVLLVLFVLCFCPCSCCSCSYSSYCCCFFVLVLVLVLLILLLLLVVLVLVVLFFFSFFFFFLFLFLFFLFYSFCCCGCFCSSFHLFVFILVVVVVVLFLLFVLVVVLLFLVLLVLVFVPFVRLLLLLFLLPSSSSSCFSSCLPVPCVLLLLLFLFLPLFVSPFLFLFFFSFFSGVPSDGVLPCRQSALSPHFSRLSGSREVD